MDMVVKTRERCRHSFFELREDPARPGKQKPIWECHHTDKKVRETFGQKQDGCQTCPVWVAR